MIKFTVISKNAIWHLAIWQNWCLVNFIIQKLKSKNFVCLSFLWRQVFLREREETCFWRFLRSDVLQKLKYQLDKNNWGVDVETYMKS